jgi:hypothetical protein
MCIVAHPSSNNFFPDGVGPRELGRIESIFILLGVSYKVK